VVNKNYCLTISNAQKLKFKYQGTQIFQQSFVK
jgi:hypothetical protein